ncbi:NACHT domain-containing protein [Brachyspira murdochii]|uniref:NACHT C-terminal Helical domain-containing protein n=1 Tax=Brachyspira murdochii (strain ATCC 51284 / DSM 12563 / 56-150) TaxID=526224 RepID=D5UBB0_BRAM5|nr:hypothetical protein [Brachyspira murdochii]ADG71983.1 hypothetical protein Bmur_1904 [Brachyspira murdochii DSM 12563]
MLSDYSFQYKEEKIKSIKDEVKELHPLLKDLFSKMDGIKYSEYTHGINEYGADFILEIKHSTLPNESIYVGVIVKSGKIEKNKFHSDIIPQIRDCYLPKKINSGRTNITIQEVWVITNSTFSHGSKVVINEYSEFNGKRIIFFEYNNLIKLIDNFIPEYWMNISLELNSYFKELRIQLKNEDIAKSVLTIPGKESIYIKPRLIHKSLNINEQDNLKEKYKEVNIDDLIKSGKMTIIEAQMGAGKSKLLRNICLQYTNVEKFNTENILPIYISFSKFVLDFDGKIGKLLDSHNIYKNNNKTKFLLMIDGMDEVVIEKLNDILHDIENWCKNTKDSVFITTRYNNFADFNLNENISYKVTIAPLTSKELFNFIKTLCNDVDNKLLNDIQRSPLMFDLPKSPFAAILLAQLLNENLSDLPINLPELYKKYIELVLGRWDFYKGLTKSSSDQRILENILMILSKKLIENNIVEINEDVFDEIINTYVNSRNLHFSLEDIKSDLIDKSKILSRNKQLSSIMFSHKSFLDFFYAKNLFENDKLIVDKKLFSFYWANICYFYIGLKLDCPDILEKLINIAPIDEDLRLFKAINLPNFLMAGYHTPYNIIEDNFYKIMIEIATLFKDIVENINGNFSFFRSVSEVFLLWFFQSVIIDEFYSYNFFKKALEKSFLSLIEYKDNDDIRAYSMLFLSIISLRLNDTNILESFLSEYKDHMPIPIQVIIAYHSDYIEKLNSGNSEALQGIKKRLNKMKKYIKSLDKNYKESIFKTSIKNRISKK